MIDSPIRSLPDSEPLSIRIFFAIAEAEGKNPTDLDLQLRKVINPEAIDLLEKYQDTEWQLQFIAGGHAVTVNNREIMIDGQVY